MLDWIGLDWYLYNKCLVHTDMFSSDSDDENLEDIVVTGMQTHLRNINHTISQFEAKTRVSRETVLVVEDGSDSDIDIENESESDNANRNGNRNRNRKQAVQYEYLPIDVLRPDGGIEKRSFTEGSGKTDNHHQVQDSNV